MKVRCLLLKRKAMTNLDSILKSGDITLPTKFHRVKGMPFPVVTYGCESWTIKKAEHQRTDVFELWSWRRLLIVPMTAKRWSLSILKEINPEYSLEDKMLELKLQYFGHLKSTLIGKHSDTGKDWRQDEGTAEDEMVIQHHRINGQGSTWENLGNSDFEKTLENSEGQTSLLSHSSRVWLCATPETAAHQAPPSLGFSRQEHWSGLPFPSPMHESEKWKWSCPGLTCAQSILPETLWGCCQGCRLQGAQV